MSSRATWAASAALLTLVLSGYSQAAIFRCVDAHGVNTYSDKPCAPTEPPQPEGGAPAPPHTADNAAAPSSPVDLAREAKASKILQSLQLASGQGSDSLRAQRAVDLVAPDLVKQIDPANPAWTPQHPKWHIVLDFVKSDLRKDVAPVLRASATRTNQAAAREYAAHAQDADMDALTQYLASLEGARYVAFQNELRSLSSQAQAAMMAQEAIAEDEPSEAVLKRRQRLLALGYDSRIAADGHGPPRGSSAPGSSTMIDIIARREGNALDTLYSEYESFLPGFEAFTQSTTAKRFFAACEPALRTSEALSGVEAAEFAEAEQANYEQRWRAFYGPPVRGSGRVTTVVRSGSSGLITTRQTTYDGGQQVRESAALQCEQREDANYSRTHHSPNDPNYQVALKAIQNTCRSEQGLAPL